MNSETLRNHLDMNPIPMDLFHSLMEFDCTSHFFAF